MQNNSSGQVDPSKIMQVGMGFWASKTLLTAVKMELFTHLATGALSAEEIKQKLGLQDRGLYDFLDALVALGFLNRSGLKHTAVYSNAQDSELFLDKNKPSYMGGILEMANNRLYPFWSHLEDALKTGKPQNEQGDGEASFFDILYSDDARLREFLHAMGGFQAGNFMMFSEKFDFSNYQTHCDVGGAGGNLSIHIAKNNPHMKCITSDLPKVAPIARENIEIMGLGDRVTSQAGDFFEETFPKSDVITMGNILHDWGLEDKKMLTRKAYEALNDGGSFVVIEAFIDNDRKENAFGLMASLNMLIETDAGYDFSPADFEEIAMEVGFKEVSHMPLTGPASAVIAVK